jgi:hypothetical protein
LRAAAHPSHPQLPGELGAETPDGHDDAECDKRDPGEALPASGLVRCTTNIKVLTNAMA